MFIEVVASGGFGGITPPEVTHKIDTEKQDAEKRRTYCDAFDPNVLASLSGKDGHPGAGDMRTYTISVTSDEGETRVFRMAEDALPPEMLDLIDGM